MLLEKPFEFVNLRDSTRRFDSLKPLETKMTFELCSPSDFEKPALARKIPLPEGVGASVGPTVDGPIA
jgi:hypothetical protein